MSVSRMREGTENALILTEISLAETKLLKHYHVYDTEKETLSPLYRACILDPRQKLRGFLSSPGLSFETIFKILNDFRATYLLYKTEIEHGQKISKNSNSTQKRRERRKVSGNSVKEDAEDKIFSQMIQGTVSQDDVSQSLSLHAEPRVHDVYNENKSAIPILFSWLCRQDSPHWKRSSLRWMILSQKCETICCQAQFKSERFSRWNVRAKMKEPSRNKSSIVVTTK